jgi:hypothetical protein
MRALSGLSRPPEVPIIRACRALIGALSWYQFRRWLRPADGGDSGAADAEPAAVDSDGSVQPAEGAEDDAVATTTAAHAIVEAADDHK